MATIWFSLSGEGHGHAARARTLADDLRVRHRVRIFAAGVAFEFLSRSFGGTDVEVVRLPGLRLRFKDGRVSAAGTLADAAGYVRRLPKVVSALRRRIDRDPPDLAVCDFEPALPRAARAEGVPVLSLDHQYFLVACDLSDLPWRLRAKARMMVPFVMAVCPAAVERVVSTFFFPPLRPGLQNVTQVGPLLRPTIRDAATSDHGHLVVYLRHSVHTNVIDALRRCGREVIVYGLGERPAEGRLRFRPISDSGFMVDLATCSAVIAPAGNQLLGESLYLGKPVLAIPEEGQDEQSINARYLKACGGGDWLNWRAFDECALGRFLDNLGCYRSRTDRARLCGNGAALAAVRRHLPPEIPSLRIPPTVLQAG